MTAIELYKKETGANRVDRSETYFNEYNNEIEVVIWDDQFIKWCFNKIEELTDKSE